LCYAPVMDDPPHDDAETPMQRALRLKKAALEARPNGPGTGKTQLRPAKGMAAGASKPWMKR
jgi:hypothetical protein